MTTAGMLLIEGRTNGGAYGEWDTVESPTRGSLINALPGGSWFNTPTEITGAGGTYDADARFTILTPLACDVIYRLDTMEVPEEGEGSWTEGTETSVSVTPNSPAEVNVPAPGGFDLGRLMVVGVEWHPYA